MSDDTIDDPESGDAGEATPSRRTEAGPRTEGVRIIGATEAHEIVARTTGSNPALEFPAPETFSVGRSDGPTWADEADADDVAEAVGDAPSVSELPAVEPDQSFEMPHYAEPPTGQVPKVVISDETDSKWSGLADQPRWRDTEHHFDEQVGFEDLVDDGPRLGALGDTGEHRDFFADLDLTDDEVPTLEPAAAAVPVDVDLDLDEPAADRRPPAPRRRRTARPEAAEPRRAARTASPLAGPGPLNTSGPGGDRNLGAAFAIGVGLLALGGGCFFLGSFATMILITVVLTVCAAELFTTLNHSGYRPAGLLGIVAVAGLAIAPLYMGMFAYPVILGLTTLTGLAWFLFVQPGEGAVMNLGVTLLAVLYVGGLGSFATLSLGVARPFELDGKLSNQGIGVIVAAVLVTVSYDVGAYFSGRTFGHTPLSAASPNKTQEGLIGGVAAGVLIPFLILWTFGHDEGWAPVGVDAKTAIAFCLICALMAPIGDLSESAIKRDLGVKDMGSLLPGHGGVLDRFDAMLFVLPTAYFMAHLLSLGKPEFF